MKQKKYQPEALKRVILKGMEEKKAKDVTILDMRQIENAVTNYFMICHGASRPQLEAISDGIVENTLHEFGVKPWHKEGFENAEWILLDYVDVVVHIFREDRRSFYQLEKLWADAKITHHDYKD